jgi:hypothetical protein
MDLPIYRSGKPLQEGDCSQQGKTMDLKIVFLDMVENFSFSFHRTIQDLPMEAMQWQPDPEANSIALTAWHVSRALDVLKVKILENRPDLEQLWYGRGWASRTAYDPAGLGTGGFGNLAGYTLYQVKAVPVLSAGESLEYFDQVYAAFMQYLQNSEIEAWEEPPAGWPGSLGAYPPESVYVVMLMFLLDNREHLGEIKALKAMWKRKNQAG